MHVDPTIKPISISPISIETLENIFADTMQRLNWNCVFVLPFWLKSWWNVFADDTRQMILVLRSGASIIGIAPLMIEKITARFLGNESVCDYQDVIIRDNRHDVFFSHLLDHLRQMAVSRLELGAIRPDSAVFHGLTTLAEKKGYHFKCEPAGKLYEMKLPKTWEEYMNGLDGKQRHEVNRKIRRFHEAGEVEYHVMTNKDDVNDAVDKFLQLFKVSRIDKAEFLTEPIAIFFRSLAKAMASRNMLQLGQLSLDGKTVASTFSFEYANRVFLYNNGYHPKFRNLSAGLISKIFSIKFNIKKKIAYYDFLKGNEVYKKRLGGQPVPLYRLTIHLNP